MKRAEILAEARRYVEAKTPWRKWGRSSRGLDCGGLIAVVADKFGIPYGQYTGSIISPDEEQLRKVLREAFVIVHPPVKPGMIVLLRNFGSPMHLGIIGELHGHPSLIHVGANRRFTSEETFVNGWHKSLHMIFDFPGVED